MTVEFRELQSFCDVARLRSMSKAADHLGLTQPRVTTHIKRLEEELGVVLFDRIKRPIRITSAGGTLYRLAKPLVDGMEALIKEMTEVGEGGVITVAATPVLSHPLLRVVSTFRARASPDPDPGPLAYALGSDGAGSLRRCGLGAGARTRTVASPAIR